MIIKNNWLGKDMNDFLSHKFLNDYPHYFKEFSVNPDKKFYGYTFESSDKIIEYLIFKLQKTLNITNSNFFKINLNIQHPNMDGEMHRDHNCSKTAVYMVCGEGDLVIENENILFEKDKLIVFDSNKLHAGKGPLKNPRVTLAFKMI